MLSYDISLNVYRDIMNKDKTWKEETEIIGTSSECVELV